MSHQHSNIDPPKWALSFLKWFCPPQLYEGIEGDLVEAFEANARTHSSFKTKLNFVITVFTFFRPGIFLRNRFSLNFIHTVMIKNYVKVASRNLWKRKAYAFINAFGLSVGIAFCTFIYLFIQDERSFDQFHEYKNTLYRMEGRSFDTWEYDPAKPYNRDAWLQTGLRDVLKEELPEIEYATRYNSNASGIFRYGEKVFTEKVTYVDADFFTMFSFDLLRGNKDKLFNDKSEIVLTPPIVEKYFGKEDPIGKTVSFDQEGEKQFTVTGIIESPPANSSLQFSILVPQPNRPYFDRNVSNWGNFTTPTFVKLEEGTDLNNFSRNLDKVVQKVMGDRLEKWRDRATVPIADTVKMFELVYTKVTDIHLNPEVPWTKVSDKKYSYILGGIALLIITIACINYISLALTTSTSRKTEVGVRKAIGAKRSQLVYQFGIESVMIALASMILGLGLVFLFLPAFNEFTRKTIELSSSVVLELVGVMVLIGVAVGILAGSYPSLFLSRFQPVAVLKGSYVSKVNTGFTKPLVVIQFALSAFLIISSVIMYKQMDFVTTKDLGFNKEQVIVIPTQTGWNAEADKVVDRFRTRLTQDPSVISVAGVTSSINRGYSRYGYMIKEEQKSAYVFGVDNEYIPTMGMELIAGRNFDPAIASDSTAIIVNEALVKDMGWENPLEEHLNWLEDTVGLGSKIIGVVKDYHFLSLEKNIEPAFLSMDKKSVGYLVNMLVKVKPDDIPGTLKKIESSWHELAPNKPFDYSFLDQDVAEQYASHERWMNIMGLSTVFAILISCLGLFGLAGINAVNKTKEIGIRKVMGAEMFQIYVLLNRQYVLMALIAFIIATPLSYLSMTKWLASFKYAVNPSWQIFVISFVVGILLALVTVSYHAFRAARTNPAETLKYE